MAEIKPIKKTYHVRDYPLHREIIDSRGRKTRQTYQPHDPVELTDYEASRYQHLIETEEQLASRKIKTNTKEK